MIRFQYICILGSHQDILFDHGQKIFKNRCLLSYYGIIILIISDNNNIDYIDYIVVKQVEVIHEEFHVKMNKLITRPHQLG